MNYTVLIPNVISIFLLLILLANVHNVSHRTLPFDEKIFIVMVICNICQCLGEIIAYSIEKVMLPGFHVLNLVVNALLFIINIVFVMLWVVYANYKIYEDIDKMKKHTRVLMYPALIVIIMSIVNLFVPVFFRITEDNEYQRTSLFIIPYLITYYYLAHGTLFIYKNKKQAKKYVFLPALLFMLPILVGSLIQFFFYGFSTVWTGVAIALVSVYLNLQNDVSYIDNLSGVYTRSYMYEYLKNLINKEKTDKKIVGIMLDIDNFKNINDNYGHIIGDEAIGNAGRLLHNSLPKSIVSRYGGDEFVVIKLVNSEEEINELLKIIEKAEDDFATSSEKEYSIHFSKGYSIYDFENDTIDGFIDRIDKEMYDVKKSRKKITNN